MSLKPRSRKITAVLVLLPLLVALWVWLSALAFVPVPWPDDSAFYFVGRDFFRWPPRWVMIPQAPFEPTYRIFNFNTMPLYPILVGLGRLLGIDGSFAIKFWPLSAWALSGSLMGYLLYRNRLSFFASLLVVLGVAMDPVLRWASVLVRPESLIGLFAVALVLGLSLGFPKRLQPRNFWDPVAALLALSAYAHFNAIHLLFPVILAFSYHPRRLMDVAWKTALYLSPWFLAILWHPKLFIHQMTTQWTRLAIPNAWLDSPASAISGLIQVLGSPEPWPDELKWFSAGLWLFIFIALGLTVWGFVHIFKTPSKPSLLWQRLMPPSAWVIGALWLWHTKPEVWFVYYIHLAVWCLIGLLLLELSGKRTLFIGAAAAVFFMVTLSLWVNVSQASRLGATQSWNWSTYYSFIDCIDQQLSQEEAALGGQFRMGTFRVWNPTFPDVTVELSRRHPHWEFTRTNDFTERAALAIQHGYEAEAVVVTETLRWPERTLSGPLDDYPEVHSLWMNWKEYFLNSLWKDPSWKPNRWLCQRGRWQAFIFTNAKQISDSAKPGNATH